MFSTGLARHRARYLPVAVLLAGCAHPGLPRAPAAAPVVPYVVPEGPSARLLMRGTLQPGEAYGVYVFGDGASCTGLQRVGMGAQGRDPAASALTTDSVKTLEVLVTKPNKTVCRVRWSFAPKTGHAYVVYTGTTPTGCSASVLDATNPDAMKLEASLKRRDTPGNLCVPMSLAKGVGVGAGGGAGGVGASQVTEADLPLPAGARGGPGDAGGDLGGLITP